MTAAAAKTFPGYTTAELRERVDAHSFWELSEDKIEEMRAEIARRAAISRATVQS